MTTSRDQPTPHPADRRPNGHATAPRTEDDSAADTDETGDGGERDGERGSRDDSSRPPGGTTSVAETDVLVVADHPNTGKIDRHYGPLAAVAGSVRMVCLDPGESTAPIEFTRVPFVGPRIVGILLLFPAALVESIRGEYDAVVSISLVPYGTYALVIGRLTRTPAHLGIIGADLDHHAVAWYGPVVRWLLRRFDAVTVPGGDHRRRLRAIGVGVDSRFVLRNPIDPSRFHPPTAAVTPRWDLLWVGRFAAEKDPLAFVTSVERLREQGHDVSAAMVGDGPIGDEVRAAVQRRGLSDAITLPGWVEDPRPYYEGSKLFVCTSRRDAFPLTTLEAMATGTPVVTPPVGSVTDAVIDGHNGRLVEATPAAVATATAELLDSPAERRRLGGNARRVRWTYADDAASRDWAAVVRSLTAARS